MLTITFIILKSFHYSLYNTCIKKTLIFHRLVIKFIIHHLESIIIFSFTLKSIIGRFFRCNIYKI